MMRGSILTGSATDKSRQVLLRHQVWASSELVLLTNQDHHAGTEGVSGIFYSF